MATTTVLQRGMMVRDVPGHTLQGRPVQASDFRGRRNLVLIVPAGSREASRLLAALRRSSEELQEEEAVVLIVDASADVARMYGAGEGAAALYVSDRYGEIYFAAQVADQLPGISDILGWLRFINAQCPE